MTFEEIVDQAIEMVRRRGRVTYRMLKRQFDLDDEALEDLKEEIIDAQRVAVEEDGRILVWTGDTESASSLLTSVPASAPSTADKPPPISYTPQYLSEKILTSRSALEGERKVVTVLFADIKDSTELIKDLDPEDAQKLLDPAIHIMMDAVHRFEGTVNQVLGDGIMALFGAPIAHEDHAVRACYAALAMQSTMQGYTEEVRRNQGIELRIRVGLNSGEVVVRTIGNDLHMDYSAVGPTTNLAARMEQMATPGSIRLSASTLRLVEGLVQVNALGPIPVKGMTEPVEVYELTGASSFRRRLQAAATRGLTKFVGRDTEIEALNQALEQATKGQGQVVAAVGEAGVGKSRLVYEFVHSQRTQGWRVLESASVSYGKATPYFPVIDLLKRYGHVEEGDDARTIRAKVTGQILILDESLQETIPAVLSLLDALPEDSSFLQLDPPQRRQRTLDGLKRIFLRESQVQPLLLVFEDLHWIDSETQALLDSLVESLPTAQLLLLVNYRPEYQHDWGSKTFYTQLRLDPLPPESADDLLNALLGEDASLEPLKALLIERTEGNPFFLEESVRTLVETQALAGNQGSYRLAQSLPTIQVPAKVQAVLAARIDRLPQDEKQLLQTASVMGNEVPLSLLQAIADMPEETLHRALPHLQAAEFLYEASLFPERVYTFKHALTHEVAYGSLLQERRRMLHARIVEALEGHTGNRLDDQIERLAHHAFRGEVWDKALTYFRQVGTKAAARSAYHEATMYFEQALEALAHVPEQRDTIELGVDLRIALRNALHPLAEFDRILDHLRQAEALAEPVGDAQRLGRIWGMMCVYFSWTGDHNRARAIGQRALDLATSHGDVELKGTVTASLGGICLFRGDYPQAIGYLRSAMGSLGGAHPSEQVGRVAPSFLVSCCYLTWSLAEMGTFTEGRSIGKDAMQTAESMDQPFSLAAMSCALGLLCCRKGEPSTAVPLLERAIGLSREANLPLVLPRLMSPLALAYATLGRHRDALALLEQLGGQTASGGHLAPSLVLAELGEVALHAGCLELARGLAKRGLALAQDREEQGHQAWCLWLNGELEAHRDAPDADQAETHYQQALSLANELGMRPLQAHCHRDLGKLYSLTAQPVQARAELSTAIDMYRDMEMTFWLPETEAALEQVEGKA